MKLKRIGSAVLPMLLLCLASFVQAQDYSGFNNIKWRDFKSGATSALGSNTTVFISSQSEWERFWTRLTGSPASTAPQGINFPAEQLVAVVLGNRKLGTSVSIRSVVRSSPVDVTVRYVETPAPEGIFGHSRANPYDIIRMDAQAGRVNFTGDLDTTMTQVLPYGNYDGNGTYGDYGVYTDYPYTTYYSDFNSPFNQPADFVIGDQNTFNNYWGALKGTMEAPADVDFNREMLAVIHAPKSRSENYKLVLDGVKMDRTGRTVVRYHREMVTNPQTPSRNPFVILKLPRNLNGVVFQEKEAPKRGFFRW